MMCCVVVVFYYINIITVYYYYFILLLFPSSSSSSSSLPRRITLPHSTYHTHPHALSIRCGGVRPFHNPILFSGIYSEHLIDTEATNSNKEAMGAAYSKMFANIIAADVGLNLVMWVC